MEKIAVMGFEDISKAVQARVDEFDTYDDKTAFEKTRERIDELDVLLLDALKERAQNALCSEYFNKRSRMKELWEKGVNSYGWEDLHAPLLEKICKEGDESSIEEVIQAESKLQELVLERILMGKHVARYKGPRDLPTEVKEREKIIYDNVRARAGDYGLHPDALEDFFRKVIKKNKEYQDSVKGGFGNHMEVLWICETEYKEGIEGLRTWMYHSGKNNVYLTHPGDKLHTTVEKKNNRYKVKLLRE